MCKFILSLLLWSIPPLLWANHTQDIFQVDIILFQHRAPSLDSNETSLSPALPALNKNSIPLISAESCESDVYCLLPLKSSHLKTSWHALLRQPDYSLLAHYSWRQPATNKKAVRLPDSQQTDLTIGGIVQVRKLNYYYFNSELILASAMGQAPMALKQSLRLKENQTVYVDHPQIGMLVRIEKKATDRA
ncbi:MAG: hypothetical protein JJT82_06740 [Legionellaceae bacterium]|nr:hypothetical protein [Legionellaceae bacterium]